MTGALDRELLARVLGMLGSAHDGEVLSAARQAERLRREAGVTWPEIVAPPLPAPIRERDIETVADAIDFCAEYGGALTAWERSFIKSLARWRRPFSDRQLDVLERLVAKARRAERTAA